MGVISLVFVLVFAALMFGVSFYKAFYNNNSETHEQETIHFIDKNDFICVISKKDGIYSTTNITWGDLISQIKKEIQNG